MTADLTRGVRLEWTGEGLKFQGGGTHPETPPIVIDGNNDGAPGPMLVLLLAAAGCSGSDIVLMLNKMRVRLHRLSIAVEGVRRDRDPQRYDAVHLLYHMAGDGLDDHKAERAVSLSIEKYCSVVHTLAPDVAVSYEVNVEG